MEPQLLPELQLRLDELEEELREGEITEKGYLKRKSLLLKAFESQQANQNGPADRASINTPNIAQSSQSFHGSYKSVDSLRRSNDPRARSTTQFSAPYSPITPVAFQRWDGHEEIPLLPQQLPLDPRGIPQEIFDPHDRNLRLDQYDSIGSLLRLRGNKNSRRSAFTVLDPRGKEAANISWERLASRSEKVAQVIRDKSGLYRGDRVILLYRDAELVEFAVAFLGCLMAGVVAVPINNGNDFDQLNFILSSTQAHLALTTETNLKTFQRDLAAEKMNWPKGVEWWKTNEFGVHNPKKEKEVRLNVSELAYIEFSKSPVGDVRGVVISHRTIMHQVACLHSMFSSVGDGDQDTFESSLRDKQGNSIVGPGAGDVFVTYLDPRQSIGLITCVLLGVFAGQHTVWCPTQIVTTPGHFAHVISRYKATLILADYPGLKTVTFNYQTSPMQTRNFSRKTQVDFSSIKLCMIDCLTVDAEFHEILGDRWLRPLGNPRGRNLLAPMLCLPEHGGMVICMRDYLGGADRIGVPETTDADVGGIAEVLLDKEALRMNEVVVVGTGEEAKKGSNDSVVVRIAAFGFPLPDATMAVVDPETSMLTRPNIIGEIWVDSPSLSGGFWALPNSSQTIFHAKPMLLEPGSPTPLVLDQEFLRTGLLGCIIDGRLFVIGIYEDRLRQRVEWNENGRSDLAEYRYHYTMHLVLSIMRNVPRVFDCAAFDIFVNGEHLPVVLLESNTASTTPASPSGPPRQLDPALLDAIAERVMEVLLEAHQIRVYCVMITAPNMLPRVMRNGRKDIGNMLCKREFERGTLPCVHVKFGMQRAVQNLPVGEDPDNGVFSVMASQQREMDLLEEKQYSGIDNRDVIIDDRTSQPLTKFKSIVDILQWRVARQTDELSYCTVDSRSREGKGISWKKLDQRIASVAFHLKNKAKLRAGDKCVLIYTHSEEFVYAIHACFCLGLIPFPLAPLDPNRLSEDVPALLQIVQDFGIRAILMNMEVESAIKGKLIAQHLKHTSSVMGVKLPHTYNTSKPSKQSQGCRDLGFTCQADWVTPGKAVLVWLYWTPDQRRVAVQLGHDTILSMCKVQKETCQMTSSRPLLGCVRSTSGIGFLHTCLLGIFVGASTYIISPVDFAANPLILFQTLARCKVKDTYTTTQMIEHAIRSIPAKGFQLHELGNLMITFDGRPQTDLFRMVRSHFGTAALEPTAINSIYSHVLNPMITARSYMGLDPVDLWLDGAALHRGRVLLTDPAQDPSALKVQDSGMVPVSTQIAIVNPETCKYSRVGEYGEIWVASEACVTGFYGSMESFDAERFVGKIVDGDHRINYVRTGDLGFLLNLSRPIGPNGALVEMQTLFVLGSIGETFDVNGLNYFPQDIENSVQACHKNISPGGCAIFQTGGLVIVLVEVVRKTFLASLVPVIVNAILNDHQLVADVVAFVAKGDFPRSRLGEKQRGKILGAWVTKKMRVLAQFGIRANFDVESPTAQQMTDRSEDVLTDISETENFRPTSLLYSEGSQAQQIPTSFNDVKSLPSDGRLSYSNSKESLHDGSNSRTPLPSEFTARSKRTSGSASQEFMNEEEPESHSNTGEEANRHSLLMYDATTPPAAYQEYPQEAVSAVRQWSIDDPPYPK